MTCTSDAHKRTGLKNNRKRMRKSECADRNNTNPKNNASQKFAQFGPYRFPRLLIFYFFYNNPNQPHVNIKINKNKS